MKIGKGVEWAAHACALLAVLPKGWMLPAEALADYHGVPAAYMAKQMQLLSKAGLVGSTRGGAGGYELLKPATDITLWDITAAIEGRAPSFRCMEVRQNGPCGAAKTECLKPCGIAASFYAAETAFRESLSTVTIADILVSVARDSSPEKAAAAGLWIQEHARKKG